MSAAKKLAAEVNSVSGAFVGEETGLFSSTSLETTGDTIIGHDTHLFSSTSIDEEKQDIIRGRGTYMVSSTS